MNINLDKIDLKILQSLKADSRQSYSKLARKLRLVRETLFYRIKQLEKQGIIQKYVPIVPISRFGLQVYSVLIRVSDKIQKEKLRNVLQKSEQIVWMSQVGGSYDYLIAIQAKDVSSFLLTYRKLTQDIEITGESYAQRANIFLGQENLLQQNEIANLDSVSKRILKNLVNDASMKITDIAKKEKIPVSSALLKLRSLEKSGIIQGYTILIDETKLEKHVYQIFLQLSRTNTTTAAALKTYCEQAQVSFFVETIGAWNFEITLETKEDITEFLNELKSVCGASLTQCMILPSNQYYAKYDAITKSLLH